VNNYPCIPVGGPGEEEKCFEMEKLKGIAYKEVFTVTGRKDASQLTRALFMIGLMTETWNWRNLSEKRMVNENPFLGRKEGP